MTETIKVFICDATTTTKVVCAVEASSLEEARALFKDGKWDDYDEGETIDVSCDLSTVREDGEEVR